MAKFMEIEAVVWNGGVNFSAINIIINLDNIVAIECGNNGRCDILTNAQKSYTVDHETYLKIIEG